MRGRGGGLAIGTRFAPALLAAAAVGGCVTSVVETGVGAVAGAGAAAVRGGAKVSAAAVGGAADAFGSVVVRRHGHCYRRDAYGRETKARC